MSILRMLQLLIQRNEWLGWGSNPNEWSNNSAAYSYSPESPPEMVEDPLYISRLKKNEITSVTKRACGYLDFDDEKNKSIINMIQRRELGLTFSDSEKSGINNKFLPNHMTKVDQYEQKAFCGIYSADGKLLVTADLDNCLHLYNTENNEFHKMKMIEAKNDNYSITDVVFSPDGEYIVYSSWSEELTLCPIHDDSNTQESLSLSGGDNAVYILSLVFSSDSKDILCAANYGLLYLYNRECQRSVIHRKGHMKSVNSVAFADNASQIFYSGGDDGLCKVWDRRTLNKNYQCEVGIFAGHMDSIIYIDSRNDGRYLLTSSRDQTIKLWDIRVFSDQCAVENANKAVSYADKHAVWKPIEIGESSVILDGDTSVMTYKGHYIQSSPIRCHFSPPANTGQRYIYTGSEEGRIIIYDLLTGKIVKILEGHEDLVKDVSWHPYNQEIISTSWDGVIGCWRYSSPYNIFEHHS